jgi:hypothetical protein
MGFIAPPDVHCNDHHTNMAVCKQSDAAVAAATTSKLTAKVVKPKHKTSKSIHLTSQQSLCPRGNPCSPMENNTNLHITNINLNRDRFDNVLTALGGSSPGKNITPPDSPTDPLDEPVDLLPPPMPNYDRLADNELQDHGRSTVWINKTPLASHQMHHPKLSVKAFPPNLKKRRNQGHHHDQS